MVLQSVRSALSSALSGLRGSAGSGPDAGKSFALIERTGIAFIHIPKAAGMSLSKAIYSEQIGHLRWDHVWRSSPQDFDSFLKFSVCRDPADRFISAFTFLKAGGINESDRRFGVEVLADFETASDFALALKDRSIRDRVWKKVHFQTQRSFVASDRGEIMVDHLVDFSAIQTDVSSLLDGRLNVSIEHENRGPRPAGHTGLCMAARSVIQDLYEVDYSVMAMCRGPERIRGLTLPRTGRRGL